jgi:hydroxyethylthiazole kinase-like uncharacterized protein yjeF
MAEADRLTIEAGTSGLALMQQAGAAVAKVAAAMAPEGRILVLAGSGNNGGDGFAAASELRRSGRPVCVAILGDRAALSGDAARAASLYDGRFERLTPDTDFSGGVIIDALFGTGLARPIEGEAAQIIAAANAARSPILSVDLPSGIDGATGEVRGAAIYATCTVTFFRLKPGHLLLPGRAHCGPTEVADIGISDAVLTTIRPTTFHNVPCFWRDWLKRPRPADHKYLRGHVFVLSGSVGSTGAARLAAVGALRIGAGAVTVASPSDALAVNAAHLTAVMVRPCDGPEDLGNLLADPRATAAVIGPGNGVGVRTRDHAAAALASEAAVVLDADALTSWSEEREQLFEQIGNRRQSVVLTPHEGEFARIFTLDGSRLDRARQAARISHAVVVLKGNDTVVAAPDGRAAINSNAPPDLATAGSGDVLSGMIGGLLAQGMPGFEAACAGVWMHGAAAGAIGRGLISEDLPGAIPAVLKRLSDGGWEEHTQQSC